MKIVNDPQDSQINSLAPCGKSASLTTSVHAEDDTDYYCFSWAEGLKVCTVLQAREKETKTCFPHRHGAPRARCLPLPSWSP